MFSLSYNCISIIKKIVLKEQFGIVLFYLLHLRENNHLFQESNVNILAREDRKFEKGVNKAIYVKPECL